MEDFDLDSDIEEEVCDASYNPSNSEIIDSPAEIEALIEELVKSQQLNGRLDVENKYLLLRLRHQLKESETSGKKAQAKILKLQEDIAELMKLNKFNQSCLEKEKVASKELLRQTVQDAAHAAELANALGNLKWGFHSREVSLRSKLEEHKRAVVMLSTTSEDTRSTLREICETVCAEINALDDLVLIEEEEQLQAFEEEADLRGKVEDLQSKLSELREIHEVVREEKEIIEKHCIGLENELEETSDVLSRIKAKHASELEKMSSKFQEMLADTAAQVLAADEKSDRLERELTAMKDQGNMLLVEGDNWKAKYEDLVEQTAASSGDSDRISDLEEKLADLKITTDETISGLQETISDLQEKITSLTEENAHLCETANEYRTQELVADAVDKEKEEADKELVADAVEKESADLRALHQQEIASLQSTLNTLQEEFDNQQDEMQKLLDEVTDNETVKAAGDELIASLRDRVRSLEGDLERLNAEKAEPSDQPRSDWAEELASKDLQIAELKNNISALVAFMDKQQSEGEGKLRAHVSALQSDKMKLQADYEEHVGSLRSALAVAEESVASLKANFEDKMREMEDQSRSAMDKLRTVLEARYVELHNKYEALHVEKDTQQAVLEEQVTRLKVNSVLDKSEYERQLAEFDKVVENLTKNRERREEEYVKERDSLKARYKRNEEVYEQELQKIREREKAKEEEMESERAEMIVRDQRREEDFVKAKEAWSRREAKLEEGYKRSLDEIRSRELRRDEELTKELHDLKEANKLREEEYVAERLRYAIEDRERTALHSRQLADLKAEHRQAEAELRAELAELGISVACKNGEEPPVILERLAFALEESTTRSFCMAEMSSTIMALWERVQELDADLVQKTASLATSEHQVHSLKRQVSELEGAMDSAEAILTDSASLQEDFNRVSVLKVDLEERLNRALLELFTLKNAEGDYLRNMGDLKEELSQSLRVAKQTEEDGETLSYGQFVIDASGESKSFSPEQMSRSFLHSSPEFVASRDIFHLDGIPNAESSVKDINIVEIFETCVRYLLLNSDKLSLARDKLGESALLKLCGEEESSSKRLRDAIDQRMKSAISPHRRGFELNTELDSASFDHGHGHRSLNDSLRSDEGSKRSITSRKSSEKVILRKPIDKTLGRRLVHGSSSEAGAHRVSDWSSGDSRVHPHSSLELSEDAFPQILYPCPRDLLAVSDDDYLLVKNMEDTYNSFILKMSQIDASDGVDELAPPLSSGSRDRGSYSPVPPLPHLELDDHRGTNIYQDQANVIIRDLVGGSSGPVRRNASPVDENRSDVAEVNVLHIFEELEKVVQLKVSVLERKNAQLEGEVSECRIQLQAQYSQLESLGKLVLNSRKPQPANDLPQERLVAPSSQIIVASNAVPAMAPSPNRYSAPTSNQSLQENFVSQMNTPPLTPPLSSPNPSVADIHTNAYTFSNPPSSPPASGPASAARTRSPSIETSNLIREAILNAREVLQMPTYTPANPINSTVSASSRPERKTYSKEPAAVVEVSTPRLARSNPPGGRMSVTGSNSNERSRPMSQSAERLKISSSYADRPRASSAQRSSSRLVLG